MAAAEGTEEEGLAVLQRKFADMVWGNESLGQDEVSAPVGQAFVGPHGITDRHLFSRAAC